MRADPQVLLLDWQAACPLALPLREAVFVQEQGVPADMERDEFDPVSVHAVAEDAAGAVVGTGRLLPDGHIGRMAVRADCRGQGVGAAVLVALMSEALRRGHAKVVLNAQVQAAGFYKRFGFEPEGDEFDEAGLPHQAMVCVLGTQIS